MERCLNPLKDFRAVASRYDMPGGHSLAVVRIARTVLWPGVAGKTLAPGVGGPRSALPSVEPEEVELWLPEVSVPVSLFEVRHLTEREFAERTPLRAIPTGLTGAVLDLQGAWRVRAGWSAGRINRPHRKRVAFQLRGPPGGWRSPGPLTGPPCWTCPGVSGRQEQTKNNLNPREPRLTR